MEKNIRSFIAIKIIPGKKLSNLYSGLRDHFANEKIKWVKDDLFHITLKFLGEIPAHLIKNIETTLIQIASNTSPFEISIKGIGYFKQKKVPQVLFAKIEDYIQLKEIADDINKRLLDFGFERETKPFKAHITLGRIKYLKDKAGFYSQMEKLKDLDIQKTEISELVLYKSVLTPSGPIYTPISNFKLQEL